MKLAILGGSYNPVHIGHLLLAETVLNALNYDRIILVPAFISPFKPGAEGASPSDRLNMASASVAADPRLTVDDCEIRREGISYTIDTIEDIESRYRPEGKLGLILGDDLACDFPKWRRAGDIMEQADIIIARRMSAVPVSMPYPCVVLNNELLDISSQSIRNRIRQGGNWRYLVPLGARIVIEDRHLYGAGSETSPSSPELSLIVRVEAAAKAMLSPSRFLHSRNVALLARDICLRFGLDPAAGYLAGIAHDICKSLPLEELRGLTRQTEGGEGREQAQFGKHDGSLLHAEAGAVFLQTRFGVDNKDILNAVRFHTTGGPDMGPLAKAVYIADKVEPSRKEVRAELREPYRYARLDSFFEAVLEENVAYLQIKKIEPNPETWRLLESLRKRRSL
ncbi:MAG: nicotinate (nicotinamide) nucleotide adenylyltransferase [Treponema sp.]|nr:nicotinate (nicotinamide) nucleotide adenylyltransferase [Treponema sp.]